MNNKYWPKRSVSQKSNSSQSCIQQESKDFYVQKDMHSTHSLLEIINHEFNHQLL